MDSKERFDLLKKICQKKFKQQNDVNDKKRERIINELNFFKKNPSLVDDCLSLLKKKIVGGDLNKPNSYLFYLVGITNKEPDYDKEFLFSFELDQKNTRLSPPDIDIDFEHRDEILNHVCELYGKEKVALIGTAQTYQPKAAVQSAAKVLDITKTAKEGDMRFTSENAQEAIRLSKILPTVPDASLPDFLGYPKKNKETGKMEHYNPPNAKVKDAMIDIQNEAKKNPEIFELALKLEGMFKNFSTHAAGVVISSEDITNDVPLQSASKAKKESLDYQKDSLMSTQFDMEDIEEIGLLKFDFLQIDTLRQMRLCEQLIMKKMNIDKLPFDLDNLKTDDKNVLKTINENKLEGLFQISGDVFYGREYPLKNFKTGEFEKDEQGNIKTRINNNGLIRIIGCNDFKDIVAANALGRPGPLLCDMHTEYAKGKKNPDSIKYLHPLLEPILKDTYSQLIFQEQLIEMSQRLAGFSYSLADKLRKACAKKKSNLLDDIKPKFFEGCERNGIPINVTKKMWDIAVEFGYYAFNKAHSTAYAEITYQTAYLKTYYPEEFICSILTSMANKSDEDLQSSIRKFKKEYKDLKILPPDINESKGHYVPTRSKMTIRSPFISLPGIGEKVSDHIISLQKFVDIEHFLDSIDTTVVNSSIIKLFKEKGVFNSIGDIEEIEIGIKKNEQISSVVKKKVKKRLTMSSGDLRTEIKQRDLF